MKAITAVCSTGASVPGISNGRVSRHRDGENAEIQMYLSKLKDLVPFMPKNRKLSKLEVIQHVIDYICDLQSALETHPAVNTFDAAAALNQPTTKHSTPVSPRQPLGVRPSPNTILTTTGTNSSTNETVHQVNSSAAITTTTETTKPVSSDRMDLC
uniref:BHLH domain-containing protein n=1 Tax=Nyssomyia neivai TaxID=330878 RepID=A0A1L8DAN8_9DIPT